MSKKLLISIAIGLLLLLALITAVILNKKQDVSQQSTTDLSTRVHQHLYAQASQVWESQFKTEALGRESSTMIRVVWQKPTQIYNHFLITITNPVTGWTRTESGEHDRVSLDVSELQSTTSYTFALQACLDPRCDAWIISDTEPQATTSVSVWQETTLENEVMEFPERDDWQTLIQLPFITLLHADGTIYTEEEKGSVTLTRVTLLNGLYEQLLTFTDAAGTVHHATLQNP